MRVAPLAEQSPPKRDTKLGTELEAVRNDVDALILQDGIDKTTALGVLKLLHTMENMLLCAQFEGERTIETLRNELTVSKLTHKQADMLETLSGDVANVRQRLSHLESALAAPLSAKKR